MKQTTNIFMEGESPTLIFAKLCYTFEEKSFFIIILWNKVIPSCLRYEPFKISIWCKKCTTLF